MPKSCAEMAEIIKFTFNHDSRQVQDFCSSFLGLDSRLSIFKTLDEGMRKEFDVAYVIKAAIQANFAFTLIPGILDLFSDIYVVQNNWLSMDNVVVEPLSQFDGKKNATIPLEDCLFQIAFTLSPKFYFGETLLFLLLPLLMDPLVSWCRRSGALYLSEIRQHCCPRAAKLNSNGFWGSFSWIVALLSACVVQPVLG